MPFVEGWSSPRTVDRAANHSLYVAARSDPAEPSRLHCRVRAQAFSQPSSESAARIVAQRRARAFGAEPGARLDGPRRCAVRVGPPSEPRLLSDDVDRLVAVR